MKLKFETIKVGDDIALKQNMFLDNYGSLSFNVIIGNKLIQH